MNKKKKSVLQNYDKFLNQIHIEQQQQEKQQREKNNTVELTTKTTKTKTRRKIKSTFEIGGEIRIYEKKSVKLE